MKFDDMKFASSGGDSEWIGKGKLTRAGTSASGGASILSTAMSVELSSPATWHRITQRRRRIVCLEISSLVSNDFR
jgi:hypothetical protein